MAWLPQSKPAFDERLILIALCPAVAMSTTLVESLAASAAITAVAFIVSSIIAASSKWIHDEFRLAASVLSCALAVAILETAMLAWFPRLRMSLGVFLPLIACNMMLLQLLLPSRLGVEAITRTLSWSVLIGSALILLGFARELVGHGSLMDDAGLSFGASFRHLEWTIFDLDMGFLLAMLPPGAFFSLGVLLAVANVILERRRSAR
jgi:Na+-translocating ferredoxin:NAD+ oxidoreductase subunit E